MSLQFEQMEAVTISTMNNQIPGAVSQASPIPTLQAGLLQPHVMAQQVKLRKFFLRTFLSKYTFRLDPWFDPILITELLAAESPIV